MSEPFNTLVVSSDDTIRQLIIYKLGEEGYEAYGCPSEEAAKQINITNFNIIIIDLSTKESETNFITSLKQNPATANIPSIVLSRRSSTNDIISALELGADDYIIKPTPFLNLKARLQAVMRRHKKKKR